MKLYLLVVAILICVASVYIFIPQKIIISEVNEVESSERIIFKYLNSSENRQKWWPTLGRRVESATTDSSVLEYKDHKFNFKNPDFNSSEVLITSNNTNIKSLITWNSSVKNMLRLRWKVSISASFNPLIRVSQYIKAHKLKSHMAVIMENFLRYVVNSKNIYGINFERTTVQDTLLATSNTFSTSYPEITEVYNRIKFIKEYVHEQDAKQVNPAMLNISRNQQGMFQLIIALPIDKIIKPGKDIIINRMVAGNILVGEIKGGPHAVEEGFNQMNLYLKDFKLVSPAMAFQSLTTNRIDEPDTTKWTTKIYCPIF